MIGRGYMRSASVDDLNDVSLSHMMGFGIVPSVLNDSIQFNANGEQMLNSHGLDTMVPMPHHAPHDTTQSFTQAVRLKDAQPSDIFENFVDSSKHSSITGEPAEISREIGGSFSLYSGLFTGEIVDLQKNRRILLKWRSSDWPEGVFSHVTITLRKVADGTKATLTQAGIPPQHVEVAFKSWFSNYWDKMGRIDESEARKLKRQRSNGSFDNSKRYRKSSLGSNSVTTEFVAPGSDIVAHGNGLAGLIISSHTASLAHNDTHSSINGTSKIVQPISKFPSICASTVFSESESESVSMPIGSPIVHVDIPCKDFERVKLFYGTAFGWTFKQWTEYYTLFNTGTSLLTGGFWLHKDEIPRDRFVTLYISVEDIELSLNLIQSCGGEVVQGKTAAAIPTVGYYAFFRDSEGNQIGLNSHQ